MKKVSIVIPIYNAEKYLINCINSILNQTYKNIEILLVDDGSNDGSKKICEQYQEKDERIRAFFLDNHGVSTARNFGMDMATGDYIIFVDADDTIDPDTVGDNVKLAEENNVELVLFCFRYLLTEERHIKENELKENFCGTSDAFFKNHFNHILDMELVNPPWNKLIKKSLLDRSYIRFHPSYSICEDMAFSIDVLSAVDRLAVNRKAYYNYFLKTSGSLVFTFHENYFEAATHFYNKAQKYCCKFPSHEPQMNKIDTIYAGLVIAYIQQICCYDKWDREKKFKYLSRITESSIFCNALQNARLPGKKRIARMLIRCQAEKTLYFLYNIKSRLQLREKLVKIKYKVEDGMLLGSVYDYFMKKTKYRDRKLTFLYNVIIGQKHRMLYYKKLKKKYLDRALQNTYWEEQEKKENSETVWICWLQGMDQAPLLVKRCYESIRRSLPNKKIILVDEENIYDYVVLPDYIVDKRKQGKIGNAHFSDLIRLELLIKYGGYWIDATVLCTDAKLFYYIDSLPLFMFSFYYFGIIPEIMETNNWFIKSTANNNIICLVRELLYAYWKENNRPVHYFLFHIFMTMALECYEKEYKEMPVVSQADAHILASYISEPYNRNKYDILKLSTGIHKLNTRFDERAVNRKNTFYDVIIKQGNYQEMHNG